MLQKLYCFQERAKAEWPRQDRLKQGLPEGRIEKRGTNNT